MRLASPGPNCLRSVAITSSEIVRRCCPIGLRPLPLCRLPTDVNSTLYLTSASATARQAERNLAESAAAVEGGRLPDGFDAVHDGCSFRRRSHSSDDRVTPVPGPTDPV